MLDGSQYIETFVIFTKTSKVLVTIVYGGAYREKMHFFCYHLVGHVLDVLGRESFHLVFSHCFILLLQSVNLIAFLSPLHLATYSEA